MFYVIRVIRYRCFEAYSQKCNVNTCLKIWNKLCNNLNNEIAIWMFYILKPSGNLRRIDYRFNIRSVLKLIILTLKFCSKFLYKTMFHSKVPQGNLQRFFLCKNGCTLYKDHEQLCSIILCLLFFICIDKFLTDIGGYE